MSRRRIRRGWIVWKNTGSETGRALFLYTPAAAGGYVEELPERRGRLYAGLSTSLAGPLRGCPTRPLEVTVASLDLSSADRPQLAARRCRVGHGDPNHTQS